MMEVGKIYNEDAIETMKRMPDGFVDLVVTSPPYDNLRTYDGHSEFDFPTIARELYRVVKEGGVVVWVVGDETSNGSESGQSFRQALFFSDLFTWHDTMIYHKTGLTFPETNRYYPAFEYMFIFSKGKPKTVNLLADKRNRHAGDIIQGGSRQVSGVLKRRSGYGKPIKEFGVRQNVWTYSTGWMVSSQDEIAFQHPAQMPEQLAKDHIVSWSKKGDLVYDPFMGSGTTAKAAALLEREWLGSELNAKYVELAQKRLDPHLKQERLEL